MIVQFTGDLGYRIFSMNDGVFTTNFNSYPLFNITLLKNQDNTTVSYGPEIFNKKIFKKNPDNTISISLYDQTVIRGIFKVQINGKPGDASTDADLRISVDFKSPDYSIYEVQFPALYVSHINNDNSNQVLVFPRSHQDGGIIRQPSTGSKNTYDSYPGNAGAQFMTLFNYGNDQCFYVAALDPDNYPKGMYYDPGSYSAGSSSGVFLRYVITPENAGSILYDFKPKYYYRLSSLSGDWYDGCVKYKSWATGQWWCTTKGTIWSNPNNLHNQSIVMTKIGFLQAIGLTTRDCLTFKYNLDKFAAGFPSIPARNMITTWYDWHNSLYSSNDIPWPYWNVNSGLSTNINLALKMCADTGYNVSIYTLPFSNLKQRAINRGVTWFDDHHTPDHEVNIFVNNKLTGLGNYLVSRSDSVGGGLVYTDTADTPDLQRSGDQMALANLYSTFITGGTRVSGLYIDVYPYEQPSNFNPLVETRGSTPKTYNGYANVIREYKRLSSVNSGNLWTSSEYQSEITIPVIDMPNCYRNDGNIFDLTTNWRSVPVMSTLYHDYSRMGQFVYITGANVTANIFHDGRIPGFILDSDSEGAGGNPLIGNFIPAYNVDIPGYVNTLTPNASMLSTIATNSGVLDPYLVFGARLRPLSGSREWLTIRNTDVVTTGSLINYSAWMSPTGSIGVFITNSNLSNSMPATILMPSGKYPFTNNVPYNVYVYAANAGSLGSWTSSGTITNSYTGYYVIPSMAISLIEFRR